MFVSVHPAVIMLHGDGKQNPRNLRVQPLGGGDEALIFDLVHDGVYGGPQKPTVSCRVYISHPDLMDPMQWAHIGARIMDRANKGYREIELDFRTPLFEPIR